jgi:hypothetical protein
MPVTPELRKLKQEDQERKKEKEGKHSSGRVPAYKRPGVQILVPHLPPKKRK